MIPSCLPIPPALNVEALLRGRQTHDPGVIGNDGHDVPALRGFDAQYVVRRVADHRDDRGVGKSRT